MDREFTIKRGELVYSRSGDQLGKTTGGTRSCRLEGCRGIRIGVRWPDGSLTWPCTDGMGNTADGAWRIL